MDFYFERVFVRLQLEWNNIGKTGMSVSPD